MYEVRVNTKFSAAHHLRNYDGQCENLHGHTWMVEVCVRGGTLNKTGFVYDFRTVKDALKEIISKFDHAYINEVAPFDKLNPTAENLACYIYNELKHGFAGTYEVSVWESENARAVYRDE
ncbi:MAG: 6-carboxytetrahydropterin synthase QueD [Pseudomonadota bacterium]